MNRKGTAKLTPIQVKQIREYLERKVAMVWLAKRFGVATKTIANIKHRRTHTGQPRKEREPVLPGER